MLFSKSCFSFEPPLVWEVSQGCSTAPVVSPELATWPVVGSYLPVQPHRVCGVWFRIRWSIGRKKCTPLTVSWPFWTCAFSRLMAKLNFARGRRLEHATLSFLYKRYHPGWCWVVRAPFLWFSIDSPMHNRVTVVFRYYCTPEDTEGCARPASASAKTLANALVSNTSPTTHVPTWRTRRGEGGGEGEEEEGGGGQCLVSWCANVGTKKKVLPQSPVLRTEAQAAAQDLRERLHFRGSSSPELNPKYTQTQHTRDWRTSASRVPSVTPRQARGIQQPTVASLDQEGSCFVTSTISVQGERGPPLDQYPSRSRGSTFPPSTLAARGLVGRWRSVRPKLRLSDCDMDDAVPHWRHHGVLASCSRSSKRQERRGRRSRRALGSAAVARRRGACPGPSQSWDAWEHTSVAGIKKKKKHRSGNRCVSPRRYRSTCPERAVLRDCWVFASIGNGLCIAKESQHNAFLSDTQEYHEWETDCILTNTSQEAFFRSKLLFQMAEWSHESTAAFLNPHLQRLRNLVQLSSTSSCAFRFPLSLKCLCLSCRSSFRCSFACFLTSFTNASKTCLCSFCVSRSMNTLATLLVHATLFFS